MTRVLVLVLTMLWTSTAMAQNYSRWMEVAFFDTMEFTNSSDRINLTVGTAANSRDRAGVDMYCEANRTMLYVSDTAQPVGSTVSISFDNGVSQTVSLAPSPNRIGGITTDDEVVSILANAMGASTEMTVTYVSSGFSHTVPLDGAETASERFLSTCAALQEGSYDLDDSLARRTEHAVPYGDFLPLEVIGNDTSYRPGARIYFRSASGVSSYSVISVTCSPGGYSLIVMDSVTPFPQESSISFSYGDGRDRIVPVRRLGVDWPAYAGWTDDDAQALAFLSAIAAGGTLQMSSSHSNYTHVIEIGDGNAAVQEFQELCSPVIPQEMIGIGWVPIHTVDTTDDLMGRRLTIFVRKQDTENPYWIALGCGSSFMRLSVIDHNTYRPNEIVTLRYRFDENPEESVELRYSPEGLAITYDPRAANSILNGLGTATHIRFSIQNGEWNSVPLINGASAAREFQVGCREAAQSR